MIELYNSKSIIDWNINAGRHRAGGDPRPGHPRHRRVQGVHGRRHRPQLPAHAGHRRPRPRQAARDLRDDRAHRRPADGPPPRPAADGVHREGFWKRGERDALAYAKAYSAYDGIIWDTACALLLRLQKATGTQLHLLHTQSIGVVEQLRRARDAGQNISAELNPWALFLGNDWRQHRAARLVRPELLRPREEHASRSGTRSPTGRSTSSPPTTGPTPGRRRSRAGPTAGRPTPAPRRPSSTSRCSWAPPWTARSRWSGWST